MPKIEIDRDWCLEAAKREDDGEIGAGPLARDPVGCPNVDSSSEKPLIIGDCDCCDRRNVELSRCWPMRIETFVCSACRAGGEEQF